MSHEKAKVTIDLAEYNELKAEADGAELKNEGFYECLVMIRKFQNNPSNRAEIPKFVNQEVDLLARNVLGIRG